MPHNSKGNIYYGMHFYPGVAEYQEPEGEAFRVFLNESTIRAMDPSFAGRPLYVEHVDGVEEDVDELRGEVDGWVIESFYNKADGKHWVKFIVVSSRGEEAIKSGMRLSNAYFPKSYGQGGMWNGVSYQKEVTAGEYEHLALVRNPRYDESVVKTPAQFKAYNEEQTAELTRLANSKDKKGDKKMGAFSVFKKSKVENSDDIAGMSVMLPKSKKEITLEALINAADTVEVARSKNELMAETSHQVKMHDGTMCNVGELVAKHKTLNDELSAMKKSKAENEEDDEEKAENEEDDEKAENAEDDEEEKAENEEDEDADDEKKKADKKKNELKEAADKKAAAKLKADKVRNARASAEQEEAEVLAFSGDQVERGKSLYGSGA